MYALLVRAKGNAVTGSDVHDAWAAWALDAKPDHPAIYPFDELDRETQMKDDLFVGALRRVAALCCFGHDLTRSTIPLNRRTLDVYKRITYQRRHHQSWRRAAIGRAVPTSH